MMMARPLRACLQYAVAALAAGASLPGMAGPGLQPLSDTAMSDVRGGDGVSFDLSGFAMSGNVRVTYTPKPGASIYTANLSASRSDSSAPFADPYRLDIVRGAPGLADVVNFSLPQNVAGQQRWQMAYDFGVDANGIARDGGAIVIDDMVFRGGGWQFSTPRLTDGVAFGAALRMDIGQLAVRPNGRSFAGEQLALQGVHIGATDTAGNFTNAPWVIADVATQPAVVNAVADDSGPRLHIGIGWPDTKYGSGQAGQGGIQIDKIAFTSPSGNVDLGSSRIGGIQIQYLDIKFRQ